MNRIIPSMISSDKSNKKTTISIRPTYNMPEINQPKLVEILDTKSLLSLNNNLQSSFRLVQTLKKPHSFKNKKEENYPKFILEQENTKPIEFNNNFDISNEQSDILENN